MKLSDLFIFFLSVWVSTGATHAIADDFALNANGNVVATGPLQSTYDGLSVISPGEPVAVSQVLPISKGVSVVAQAFVYLGTPYKMGGVSPVTGFDCSGFVHFVYKNVLGLNLPRSPQGLSKVGQRVTKDELKAGDLVFFNTLGGQFSHVGIFVSGTEFIHSPHSGKTVEIARMDSSYYRKRFTAAVRLAQ